MIRKFISIIALILPTAAIAQDQATAPDPDEVVVVMSDDGYVEVPLEFTFSLYGQTFDTSWMYDNGIISFLEPGSPMAISPWQWNAQDLNSTGSYFIAPLWADIAPTSLTKYSYITKPDSMTYSWSNIAEYYSAWDQFPRYSSFSTTIKPDGNIITNYYSVNLQTSNIRAGIVGDSSLGQYETKYSFDYGTQVTSLPNWSLLTEPPAPPPEPEPEPPVIYQPDTGFQDIITDSIAASQVVSEPEAQTVVETVLASAVQEVIEEPSVIQEPVQQILSSAAPLEQTAALLIDTPEKKLNPNALSIARNNQQNLAQLTNSVVSSSIAGSLESSLAGVPEAVSQINSSSAGTKSTAYSSTTGSTLDQSMEASIAVTGFSPSMGVASSDSSSTDTLEASQRNTSTSTAQVAANNVTLLNAPSMESMTPTDTNQAMLDTTDSLAIFNRLEGTSDSSGPGVPILMDDYSSQDYWNRPGLDEINPISVRSLAALSTVRTMEEEETKESNTQEDTQTDPALEELANSGVKLTSFQVAPIGYFSYLNFAYPDVSFYPDRQIYRKQKVVDNQRLLRLLNYRNDRVYNQMVEDQYNLGAN